MSSAGMPTSRLSLHQEWEYHVAAVSTAGFFGPKIDLNELNMFLNEKGAHGWEVVTMVSITVGHGSTQDLLITMKRPKA